MKLLTVSQQAEKYRNDNFRYEMMRYLGELDNSIWSELEFTTIEGGAYSYNRETAVAFQGEDNTGDHGILNPFCEILDQSGGEIKVDKAIAILHGDEMLKNHRLLNIKSMSLSFNSKFMCGNDVNMGLKDRVIRSGTQDIKNDSCDGSICIDSLNEAIGMVDDPTHIIMDVDVRRIIREHVTKSKKDNGGVEYHYKGLKIISLDCDHNKEKILGFNEEGETTSVYVVSFDEESIIGVQSGDLLVEDLGKDESYFSMSIDHEIAYAMFKDKSASRLKGVAKKKIK